MEETGEIEEHTTHTTHTTIPQSQLDSSRMKSTAERPPPHNTPPVFTFSAGKQQLGVLAIIIAIIGAFFSTAAFSLDHAVLPQRLHQHIFTEYNLIAAIIIIIALVFVFFNPTCKWIYYSIFCTAIVFVLLNIANFIIHMALIDKADGHVTTDDDISVLKLVKAGAAFTFMDGVFKILIAVICIVIVALKV